MSELAYRELYCPAHFGNSYEAMAPYEMKDVLEEAKFWGLNAYGDWLDAADIKDPYSNPRGEYLVPQALLERKLAAFRAATDLGLSTDLILTPNHVYLNQLKPDLLADTSDTRFFGQLLCPSKPDARKIILENHQNLFKDMAAHGIRLDSIAGCPFDYGGCACDSCKPWIVTFGKLMVDIRDIAREFFPEVKARLIGWWWTEDEHKLFKAWADANAKGKFVSLAAHLPYGQTRPKPGIVLPDDCDLHAFVHIGYGDKAAPSDTYGAWGPVVASNRIAMTCYELKGIGAKGFMAYSEGVFDDVNKALLAAIASGKAAEPSSVLEEYAARYFGARGAGAKDWAEWLANWSSPFEVDAVTARRRFDVLSRGAKQSWRLRQFESRLRLFEAHSEVKRLKQWDDARTAAAERFLLEREKLYREVWGLGLVRHVVSPHFNQPDWYSDYSKRPIGKIDREA